MPFESKSYYKWIVFFTVSIGTFMGALDSSIVNVSLPAIKEYFHTDISCGSWVTLIYLLGLMGFLMIFGKLADIASRKAIFISGLAVFVTSSLVCGIADSLTVLIAARFVQAIGSAMITANSSAIITDVFPPQERGKALGAFSTVVSIGLMIGAPLGGKIVEAWGWQYIFFINIPIGIVGMIIAAITLKEKREAHTEHGFDLLGSLLLVIFMTAFLLALSTGGDGAFNSGNFITLLGVSVSVTMLFIISAVSFVLFLVTEHKAKNPTMPLALFKNISFASSTATSVISYTAIFIVMFLIPFFLKQVKGLPPSTVGQMLALPTFMYFICSPLFGWVSDKRGYRLLRCLGFAIMGIGIFLLSKATDQTTLNVIRLELLIYGLGMGMFIAPNNSLMMGSVPKNQIGVASGILATTRTMGMMIGIATATASFTYLEKYWAAIGQPKQIGGATIYTRIPQYFPYNDVFLIGALICLFGLTIAFIAKE